jgi:hypothetical protein
VTVAARTSTSPGNCARAASAAELRFRIDKPIVATRAARIIALDDTAASALSRIADRPWAHARFYLCEPGPDGAVAADPTEDGGLADAAAGFRLREIGGPSFPVSGELTGTDVVVVVAARGAGPGGYAAGIGQVCAERSIMTAGVVLGSGPGAEPEAAADAVAALRPYARVLLPTADEGDLVELLTALRV